MSGNTARHERAVRRKSALRKTRIGLRGPQRLIADEDLGRRRPRRHRGGLRPAAADRHRDDPRPAEPSLRSRSEIEAVAEPRTAVPPRSGAHRAPRAPPRSPRRENRGHRSSPVSASASQITGLVSGAATTMTVSPSLQIERKPSVVHPSCIELEHERRRPSKRARPAVDASSAKR